MQTLTNILATLFFYSDGLLAALEVAFQFDTEVVVESAVLQVVIPQFVHCSFNQEWDFDAGRRGLLHSSWHHNRRPSRSLSSHRDYTRVRMVLNYESVLFSVNSPFNMSESFQRWILPYQPFGAGDPDPHTGQDTPRRGGRRGCQGGQGGLQVYCTVSMTYRLNNLAGVILNVQSARWSTGILHGIHDLQSEQFGQSDTNRSERKVAKNMLLLKYKPWPKWPIDRIIGTAGWGCEGTCGIYSRQKL